MADEIPSRSGGETDGGNAPGERESARSALQVRAAFLQNWDWELVNSLNRAACERGRSEHGHNPEAYERVRHAWEDLRSRELTFKQLLEFLRACHWDTPFFYFNGNTFAELARRATDALLAEFPLACRREAASLAAHYVAGVLNEEALVLGLQALTEPAELQPGDRVKSLQGSV